jgi:16S rRNA (adenine1518-N6/adenine1519-N6)-dimethyltransferase
VTHSRPAVAALLEEFGLAPSRALGQNFVVDPNTVRKIARLAKVGDGDFALEIGPGLGSLTLALAETGATIEAIEVDRHLLAPLRRVVEPAGVVVHHADALHANYQEILRGRPTVVVANLPYNVATPLILHLLETVPEVTRMLVMVQLEVAERFAASPTDEAFGAVSLRTAYFATAKVVGKVPASVFLPRPKVESGLLEITRRESVLIDPARVGEAELFEAVRTAFAQRRKMLRHTLKAWASDEVFVRAGVDPTARPETLSLEDFARLVESR